MTICVAGWYFDPALVAMLRASKHPSFWVCHRPPPAPLGMPCRCVPNVGLEFGCYSWFLRHEWKSGSVLFMHDDARVAEDMLDGLSGLDCDHAYVFGSEAEAAANGKAHGRAIWCSAQLLVRLKTDGGIWFDESPSTGRKIPATTETEPDWHNIGIRTFEAQMQLLRSEFTTDQIVIVPGIKLGYRGAL